MTSGAHKPKEYEVQNGHNRYHLIPYVGNKSGFSHIFDDLMPDEVVCGRHIVDVFGGSGAFAIYACFRFGAGMVTYNDNNPVLVNFMKCVRDDVSGLITQYEIHRQKSTNDYFLEMRAQSLADGLKGAATFLYLAKNAFSGKIRFNRHNMFNTPMRKNSKCPAISAERLHTISGVIQGMSITNKDFTEFSGVRNQFLYLDPPYMNNPNQHYNGVPTTERFVWFVNMAGRHNHIMLSEQNSPDTLDLSKQYHIYRVTLRRSLQYITQKDSAEIIAINYDV